MLKPILPIVMCALVAGCAFYGLVAPGTVPVANDTMVVQPKIAWNRSPPAKWDLPNEEHWTLNGPVLDSIAFIGAVPDGGTIVKRRPNDIRELPVFRSGMSAQDLASMLESYYRLRTNVATFVVTSIEPGSLAGEAATQLDFSFVAADEVKRRGRALLAIVDGRLYLAALDGEELHYFGAALPQFESMLATATLVGP